jgi:hypothetical protein
MKPWILVIALLALIGGVVRPIQAQSAGFVVEVTDEQESNRSVTVQMRVIDPATRQEVGGISERDITIMQDGQVLNTQMRLESRTTNALDPATQSVPYNGSQNLIASGATIGIVADLSTALNRNANGADYIAEIRAAAEQWIKLGGPVAPGDPERIGLFIPRSQNAQALQPAGIDSFEFDHNKVISALRQEPPRDGATDLYDALLAAIEATSAEAQRRGTPAYVVVFSDGTVTNRTDDPSGLVLQKAAAGHAAVIGVGIGNPASLERDINRLPKIADATGGRYIQVAPAEREAALAQAYADLIIPVNRTAYTLTFLHTAPLDNEIHTFQIKINRDGQDWVGPTLPIPFGAAAAVPTEPLPYVAVQKWYLLRTLPLAIIVAGAATFIAWLGRKKPTRIEPTRSDPGATQA